MTKFIIGILLMCLTTSCGQADSSILNGEGSSLEELIPSGWKILDNKIGDLNQDGFQDLAFVIQDTDPDAFSLNDGFGGDTLDLNP